MVQIIKNKILRRIIKSISITLLVILVLPFSLYIPVVQDFVKDIIITEMSKATGWNVSIDKFYIHYPLNIGVENVLILDEKRDTMIMASSLDADISIIPLLRKTINISVASLKNGNYYFINKDSSMVLRAKLQLCTINDASVDLANNRISLGSGNLNSGDVTLRFFPENEKATPPDTTASSPWNIKAKLITLENVHYAMQMLPLIDNLEAIVGRGELRNGEVDTGKRSVNADYIAMDNVNASYFTPNEQTLANMPEIPIIPVDTLVSDSSNWTIKGTKIRLSNAKGIYAIAGISPKAGLDMDFLQGSEINIDVDSFFNCGTNIRVPIKRLTGKERCGVSIVDCSGVFYMDSTYMAAENFNINTELSHIFLDTRIDNKSFALDPNGRVNIIANADIALGDIQKLYPTYSSLLKTLPNIANIDLSTQIRGTISMLDINQIKIQLPRYADLNIKGKILNAGDSKRMNGRINLDGDFANINFLKPSILDLKLQKEIEFPPLSAHGDLAILGNQMMGNIDISLPSGKIAADAKITKKSEIYDIALSLDSLPINAFMPLSKFGNITGELSASGRGFNPLSAHNELHAKLHILEFTYNKHQLTNISASADMSDGHAVINLESRNQYCDMDAILRATYLDDHYNFILDTHTYALDLQQLDFSTTKSNGHFNMIANGDIDLKTQLYDFTLSMRDILWRLPENNINTQSIDFALSSSEKSFTASLDNNDFKVEIKSPTNLDSFIIGVGIGSDSIMSMIKQSKVNFKQIQNHLPQFIMDASIGDNNLVSQYLGTSGIEFDNIACTIANDSILYVDSKVNTLQVGKIIIDTLTVSALEHNKDFDYNIHIGNKYGNMDEFAQSNISGSIGDNRFSALFSQSNRKQKKGFNIGVEGTFCDSAVNINFFPFNPVIGYRTWIINQDNFINYQFDDKKVTANIFLQNDSSKLSIITYPKTDLEAENLKIHIDGIHIGEWLNLSPFAPKINGELGGDMVVSYDGKNMWGKGDVALRSFIYNGNNVGDLAFDMGLSVDPIDGFTKAVSSFSINGEKVIKATGIVNDTTSSNPYKLALTLDKFPLNFANPFIPQGLATASGYLNGNMSVTGSFSEPILNGSLKFKTATVNLPLFGSQLKFPERSIPVDSNIIRFNNFEINGSNSNPLTINGLIKIKDIHNPELNLSFKGQNVQFVNSKQNRMSQLYGNGFMDVDASVKGDLSNLNVNARLALLAESNITYVMQSDVNSITQQKATGVVKFVEFNDTSSVKNRNQLLSSEFNMNLQTNIIVESGAMINVNLSPDGKNKIQIEGNANLNYNLNAVGDSRFTGRYTINRGFVRYSPPLISEKLFNFSPNSYVSWSGNIMNPTFNITATENFTTNVSVDEENTSRVNFLITMYVTNTLNDIKLSFDLTSLNDMSIAGELQSSTPEQRSNQALNLLLYGSYVGISKSATTTTAASFSTGQLYSFLAGQLNNWASKYVKGVDLSFGINQYDKMVDGTSRTSVNYSYQVSKTLFNDRFKITVGGNYDTEATNNNNLAQSLINDISLEYTLTKTGNIYVKVFRHTGYESMFEGQVTQTGVGLVFRRKLDSLKNIFRFNLGKRKQSYTPVDTTDSISQTMMQDTIK